VGLTTSDGGKPAYHDYKKPDKIRSWVDVRSAIEDHILHDSSRGAFPAGVVVVAIALFSTGLNAVTIGVATFVLAGLGTAVILRWRRASASRHTSLLNADRDSTH
jgi:hypothetical protein